MKRWVKFILIAFALLFLVAITGTGWYLSKAIPIGTGYAAKYLCSSGYQEQSVCVIPSRKLVTVRFGLSSDRSAWSLEDFIEGVLAALPTP